MSLRGVGDSGDSNQTNPLPFIADSKKSSVKFSADTSKLAVTIPKSFLEKLKDFFRGLLNLPVKSSYFETRSIVVQDPKSPGSGNEKILIIQNNRTLALVKRDGSIIEKPLLNTYSVSSTSQSVDLKDLSCISSYTYLAAPAQDLDALESKIFSLVSNAQNMTLQEFSDLQTNLGRFKGVSKHTQAVWGDTKDRRKNFIESMETLLKTLKPNT